MRPSEVLQRAADYLDRHDVESPKETAEVLLMHVLQTDRAGLYARERGLDAREARMFGRAICQRCTGTPVQHLTGEQAFRRITVEVRPGVFVPRPETEILVEHALATLGTREDPVVVDAGTGSGAIALAVADELGETLVTAIDTSFDAVRVAQANAERLGLTDRVEVVLRGPSSLDGAGAGGPSFDLLVANLPYVSEDEWDELAPEIRDYEPREALLPGPTGLEAIEALTAELFGLAPRPSVIALEIGAGQADEVTRLIRAAGYEETEVRRDLAGHDRVVIGR